VVVTEIEIELCLKLLRCFVHLYFSGGGGEGGYCQQALIDGGQPPMSDSI